MRMFSSAQKHVNCFDQGVQYFCEEFSLRVATVCFHKFQVRFAGWYFTSFIYSVFMCLDCTHCWHARGDKGITSKDRITRHHEAHGRFWLPCADNFEKQTWKQCTINYCTWSVVRWSPSYRSIENWQMKWRFVKSIYAYLWLISMLHSPQTFFILDIQKWFSTFLLKGAKSRPTILFEIRTKEILTKINWHILFYCSMKYVTQNIRGVIERLLGQIIIIQQEIAIV